MPTAEVDQGSHRMPSVSIIICTDGRAEALRNTLYSLAYLDYPSFEVCVVHGPTEDGTRELLAEYAGRIKVAHTTERNLSVSRNIGIALAAGEIVAFIDDDSLPEPEWLKDLAAAYADPYVGGAGGLVYDHLGTDFQARYTTVDRLARPKIDWDIPVTQFSLPFTANIPHLLGANSSFRRDSLLAVGGFDEEYDYYLDESDVAVRLVDAGWTIATVDGAYVHHKFLPSSMRSVERGYRVLRTWYSVLKNRIYFSLRHHKGHFSVNEVVDYSRQFIEHHAQDISWLMSQGFLHEEDRARFWREVDEAWLDGWQRGVNGTPRLLTDETIHRWAAPFLPFPTLVPEGGRRTFCFVSQEYTVGNMGGIGRYTHELATSIASLGHHVHVIARSQDYDRVDFEQGVWVHRFVNKATDIPQPARLRLPGWIWDRATTVVGVLDGIAAKRDITAVSAPIWDCEGIAVLSQGRYPLVTTLHTSVALYVASTSSRTADREWMRDFARPMMQAEKRLFLESPRIVANSQAIVDEMEQEYKIRFDPARLTRIPHGLSDWSALPRTTPESLPSGSLRLLFVGRLEERKGIDTLLACAKRLLLRHPYVHLDLVGNDTITGPKGRTFKDIFESDPEAHAVRDRVTFHGTVSDERLRGFYHACDIFVAPSRFESFGLMLVEGMMFGKPVIGCNAGGMVEVVENGVSGLLAEPGDQTSLEACLERLIVDTDLRERIGKAARERYERYFTADRMAATVAATMISTADAVRSAASESNARKITAVQASPSSLAALTAVRETSRYTTATSHRVAIVAPMLARNDAISVAVRDTYRMLARDESLQVEVLTQRNDFPDVKAAVVPDLADMLIHPAFLNADLLIYHFGIFNDFFNALICGNGHAKQLVYFHNITPARYVPSAQKRIIEDSFRQIANLAYADEIWAVSEVNKAVLEEHGIHSSRIQVMPIVVDAPRLAQLGDKAAKQAELLFMGRCVPSKGILDLVKALCLVREHGTMPFRLRIAGSIEWSDQEYLHTVQTYVREHDLEDCIEFCGPVDDTLWERLYHESHVLAIPSYHEGFCKPVIEGLRSGCIPVGYASSNLPMIANGLGRLVIPGDVDALAAALTDLLEGLPRALRSLDKFTLPLDRGRMSLREFSTACHEYVGQFTFEHLADITVQRVKALLTRSTAEADTVERADEKHGVRSETVGVLAR